MWTSCSSAALRLTPNLALVTLSVVSLDSCQDMAKLPVTEEITQTYPLSAQGSVKVESSCGAIFITGWDREECSLRAVKRAGGTEQLGRLTLEVDTAHDPLAIRATVPPGPSSNPDSGPRIDLTLRVPRQAKLEIVCGRGNVTIREIDGDVVASAINGSVVTEQTTGNLKLRCVNGRTVALVSDLASGRCADLETVNGSTSLVLPPQASADIVAHVANGSLMSDVGLPIQDDFPAGKKLEGRLGAGAATVRARTANGSVSVWKGASPDSQKRSAAAPR